MTPHIRTAIVTGASRGIGAEIARQLAADGTAVAVNYANSPDAADAVVAEITAQNGRAVAIHGDLADPAAAARSSTRRRRHSGMSTSSSTTPG